MKETVTFSEATFVKRECCSRRERKRGWAVWRKSEEGEH